MVTIHCRAGLTAPAAEVFAMDLPSLLAIARGDTPADLLLKNARVVNVFTGEIEATDIAIAGGLIVGLGSVAELNVFKRTQ